MTREPLTETTRELACLALGHEDAGAPRCPESDEQLVADLVREVQVLRVAAGLVEETVLDRQERVEVVEDVLVEVDERQGKIVGEGVLLVDLLAESGWALRPHRRP